MITQLFVNSIRDIKGLTLLVFSCIHIDLAYHSRSAVQFLITAITLLWLQYKVLPSLGGSAYGRI